ncbi:MAG: alpha/beta hydrolase [Alcanivoracaceae bacterium]|nr:alpha/beta hydrolase [Alcanivoracaceae bacterium]
MRNSEEKRFNAWGLSLAARYWPGEGTPIVAVHGWLDNANSFEPLAQHFSNPFLAIDVAGHGLSEHRPADVATHYIDHVRDVFATVDAQGWDQFILLGHSMGAGLACMFAATFPERVQRLVLIEGLGPPSTNPEKAPETLRKAIGDMQQLREKKKPVYREKSAAITARMSGFGGLDEASSECLCERGLQAVDGGWTWRADSRLRLTSSMRLTEAQIEGFLRAIKAPALLVLGEQGMGGTGMFDDRVNWVETLRVERLEGRHHLHMENAESVFQAISAFLTTA